MKKVTVEELKSFYQGKKVLLTGHTGFKGSWMCVLLSLLGAEVYGYSLALPSEPALFEILFGPGSGRECREHLKLRLENADGSPDVSIPEITVRRSEIGDIRDYEALRAYYNEAEPDAVIHMAAQPIVRESYARPRETYEVNVMGTVNLLECVRFNPIAASVLNVTTDKVYQNDERPDYGYREEDKLDGFDPYSNSKSCSELVTHSYQKSFLDVLDVAVSTARAGNVIGGGDFAKDRIIPDCVRALAAGQDILIRNPNSVRPYQHVLEPLIMYLTIVMRQAEDRSLAGWYNIGPDPCDAAATGELCSIFVKACGGRIGIRTMGGPEGPHEANYLRLDNTKIKERFGWEPVWHMEEAVRAVCAWSDAWLTGDCAANAELLREIREYLAKLG